MTVQSKERRRKSLTKRNERRRRTAAKRTTRNLAVKIFILFYFFFEIVLFRENLSTPKISQPENIFVQNRKQKEEEDRIRKEQAELAKYQNIPTKISKIK